VRSIKRIMGYDYERDFFGSTFTPEDLAARIIQKLVQLAEQKLYEESNAYYDVRKAIVTVPANFFDSQIRSVLNACEQAGLDTERVAVLQAAQALREALDKEVNAGIILDEPSAAVLYYFYRLSVERHGSMLEELERPEGLRMLVFDYGGGTLDVSVANIVRLDNREAGLKILANMGDNSIGGDSIDLHLMRELVARAKAEMPDFAFGCCGCAARGKTSPRAPRPSCRSRTARLWLCAPIW
jgi:molecular chaperone DnaK